MTEQQQNIAIYRLLGYQPRRMWRYWIDKEKTCGPCHIESEEECLRSIEHEKNAWYSKEYPDSYVFSKPEEYDDWKHCPGVDLDFLHQAEETLTDEQWTDYLNNLYYITFKPGAKDRDREAVSASAEKRREAFLKALNLWK